MKKLHKYKLPQHYLIMYRLRRRVNICSVSDNYFIPVQTTLKHLRNKKELNKKVDVENMCVVILSKILAVIVALNVKTVFV